MRSRRNNLAAMMDADRGREKWIPKHDTLRTQEEVAKVLGIKQTLVRYHEANALKKLWALANDVELLAIVES